MNDVILYHGSPVIVERPVCAYGRDNLDFGKGFYLTAHRKQAEEWGRRIAGGDASKHPVLNIYRFNRDEYAGRGRCKVFSAYDREWLEFIVASRSGRKPWLDYDLIEGGVANDRVIDTVSLYIAGLIDFEAALGRLALYQPNNQVCLLNQALTDSCLTHIAYEHIAYEHIGYEHIGYEHIGYEPIN